jgi:hypothetical protein
MFIQRDERLSRPTPRRAAAQDGWHRRGPRDWQKPVKLAVYTLLGLLGGVALLATIGLLLDHPAPTGRPEPPPTTTATIPAPAPLAAPQLAAPQLAAVQPRPATPPAAAPPIPVPPIPARPILAPQVAAAVPLPPAAPPASSAQLSALEVQIREANAQLAALRAQAERSRREAAERLRAAPPPPRAAASPLPAPPPATAPPGDDAASPAFKPSYPAPSTPAPSTPAPTTTAQTTPAQTNTAPSAAVAEGEVARPGPAQRPRVYLHFRSGSAAGSQTATEIAQRLLFSDFAYADTRVAADVPAQPSVRFFWPEDAAAANRLAGLLGGIGTDFLVADFTARRGRAAHGTLEVWLPG